MIRTAVQSSGFTVHGWKHNKIAFFNNLEPRTVNLELPFERLFERAIFIPYRIWLIAILFICPFRSITAADSEEAQYNAVVALYNAGQWQAALKKIEEREKLDLTDTMRARYLYVHGLAYEKGEKTAEARAAYCSLLETWPKAPESNKARVSLIYLEYAHGNTKAVADLYSKVDLRHLTSDDRRNLALMNAESLLANGDASNAVSAYMEALNLGADVKSVNPKLFDLYLQLGHHKELVSISAEGVPSLERELVALARAEAFLALGRNCEAEAEARKVPQTNSHFARACYARAQALIALDKLTEAAEPLATAVKHMKNPPAPASARIALVECLLENNNAKDAETALTEAKTHIASLPNDKQGDAMQAQLAMLEVRIASDSGDRKKLIRTITTVLDAGAVREEKRRNLMYSRLYALSEEKDTPGILNTMTSDYPELQKGTEDGAATRIYYQALKDSGSHAEAYSLLQEFIKRKPAADETLRARLELAYKHMDSNEYEEAHKHLAAISSTKNAPSILGQETFNEVLYNLGVTALKAKDQNAAETAINSLLCRKPQKALRTDALRLLGQVYADKNDYRNAAATWEKVLAEGPIDDEGPVRERLGRLLFAMGDYAGACSQFEASSKAHEEKQLPRESLALWARALYHQGRYTDAGEIGECLYEQSGREPANAYECAVALEKANKPAEAAEWYARALKRKNDLPEEYSNTVESCLANARLASGTGDMGLDYWMRSLTPETPDSAFDFAINALLNIAGAGKMTKTSRSQIQAAAQSYEPSQPRYYSAGAVLLWSLTTSDTPEEMLKPAVKLAADFARNEGKIDKNTFAGTVAPAMIYFFKGESERLTGKPDEALASYETVLAAYPYNEWPDAAAYGAAECFATLGDLETAKERLKEVMKTGGKSPASQRWKKTAEKRLAELVGQ